jgi:hypothetical protein
MSDQTYRPMYFNLVQQLIEAGLPHPRRVWWFCPAQWAARRNDQIESMQAALASLSR